MKKIGTLKLKDHMTDDEKMKYLIEKIEILQSIMEKEGDEVCKVKRIELTDKKHTYGSCSYIGKKTVILEFSRRNFVEGNDDNLNKTIAHELIHAIVGVPPGHGKKWKDKATKYSQLLDTEIKTTSRASKAKIEGDISGAWADTSVKKSIQNPKYRLYCPCGFVNILRYRTSNMVTHPNDYRCKKCKEPILVEKLG